MTQNETINLLFNYRQKLKQEYEKPGWNFWVLVAALASLIWLILDLLENKKLEYHNSINLFFALITLELLILLVLKKGNRRTKYITSNNITIHNLPAILFFILIMGWIIIHLNWYTDLNIIFKISMNLFFAVMFLSAIAVLVFVNTLKLPMPIVTNKNYAKSFRTGFFFLALNSLVGFLILFEDWHDYLSIKSSLLFFAVYYIVSNLLRNYSPDTLILSIDTTIDDLTFNKITCEMAMDNLRLIVYGLEFKDIISPIVNEHFEIDRKFQSVCASIEQLLDQFKESNQSIRLAIIDSVEKKFLILMN